MDNKATGDGAVDFSRIQETSDGDLDFERELFGVYLEDCEDRLANLREALQSGDVERVHREAHTVKGASANVGTLVLHELAQELERVGQEELESKGSEILGRIEAEFGRVRGAIDAYLRAI